jgi:hypothetical protein
VRLVEAVRYRCDGARFLPRKARDPSHQAFELDDHEGFTWRQLVCVFFLDVFTYVNFSLFALSECMMYC